MRSPTPQTAGCLPCLLAKGGGHFSAILKTMASSQNQGPQYPAEGGAKISGDPTASVTAQGAGGGLATCDPTQSVSTQGTLGRLATCDLSGGAGRSYSTTSPARGNNIPADQFQLVAGKKRRSKKRRADDAAARGAVDTSGVPVAAAGEGAELGGGETASRTTRTRRNS